MHCSLDIYLQLFPQSHLLVFILNLEKTLLRLYFKVIMVYMMVLIMNQEYLPHMEHYVLEEIMTQDYFIIQVQKTVIENY